MSIPTFLSFSNVTCPRVESSLLFDDVALSPTFAAKLTSARTLALALFLSAFFTSVAIACGSYFLASFY